MENRVEVFMPGRIEIIGNHTDHQNGKIISSPICLGNLAVAKKNKTKIVFVTSDNYGYIKINIESLKIIENTMSDNSKRMVIGLLKEIIII